MEKKRTAPISTAVAILTGLVVLAGYWLASGQEGGLASTVLSLRGNLLNTAMLLAAVALVLGSINLLVVHIGKIRHGSKNALYSFFLILAMEFTFLVVLIQGPQGTLADWLFTYIQLPIETSLMAVLTFSLVVALLRLLRRRLNLYTAVFVFFALLTLLGTAPILGVEVPMVSDFSRYYAQVMASAGARGILLGVGLGSVATGLRILLGADRPYAE